MTSTLSKTSQKKTTLFVKHGFVDFGDVVSVEDFNLWNNNRLMTVVSNFTYYGFIPSKAVVMRLAGMDSQSLNAAWRSIQKALANITADDRDMGKYVVYKNFPQEVLNMTQGEYWFKQFLMYFGFNKDLFT